MNIKIAILLISVLVGAFAVACAKKIDAKYVGHYVDVSDPKGQLDIFANSTVSICGSWGECRGFEVTMDGATAHCQIVSSMAPTTETHQYPEFRGSKATFVIDRNTIILATGTRFIKEMR